MKKLTFENSRGEVIIFETSPFFIDSLTGIAELDADVQGQEVPYQDGDIYVDTLLKPRYPSLEGTIIEGDPKRVKQYRKHILRVCNPKLGLGKITLDVDGDIKEIEATLDGGPSITEPEEDGIYQQFLINWKCPDPYWKDPQEVSRALHAYQPTFKYPVKYPAMYGFSGDSTILENDGDVDTPVSIDIQGPVTNPQVKNLTTGEFIKINRTLSADEILHIDTNTQNKRVEIYRNGSVLEKAWGYVDDDSTFLMLIPGNNEIEYLADSGGVNGIVAIAWHNRYAGI